MDKEIKEKWVKALRSGEYKQTKGVLFDGTGYCCLGVLCEVVGMPKEEIDGMFFYKRSRSFLPSDFAYKNGITISGAFERPVKGATRLTDLNDQLGYTFDQIADVIEEQF